VLSEIEGSSVLGEGLVVFGEEKFPVLHEFRSFRVAVPHT